jgi:ribonuclease T1
MVLIRKGFSFLVAILLFFSSAAIASDHRSPSAPVETTSPALELAQRLSSLAVVAVEQLPSEAQKTLDLIARGGPFPYPKKDGTVFGNFEKRLPLKPRGYYREYTVPTPGAPTRGARRIVTGQGGELYYTKDHYRSFVKIKH